jgi:hypothetical protein
MENKWSSEGANRQRCVLCGRAAVKLYGYTYGNSLVVGEGLGALYIWLRAGPAGREPPASPFATNDAKASRARGT